MRMIRALIGALLLVGCSADGVLEVAEADSVRVEARSDALIVTNGRNAPIYFFAVDEETAAVIEWVPCTGGPGCPSVPPQSVLRLSYGAVAGNRGGGAILFYWWHVVARGPGLVPDTVRMLRVAR